MQESKRKLKPVIAVLAVLLALSVAALVGTLLINRVRRNEPETVVVPGNLIDPNPEGESVGGMAAESALGSVAPGTGTASAESNGSAGGGASAPQTKQVTAQALELYAANAGENTAFSVSNLFPGDSETKYFRVRVSHKGNVTLRYHADIRAGYDKLAEVLNVRIRLPEENTVLYEGLMRDMPASLNKTLNARAATESDVFYEITASLPTSVGNGYQAKDLIADFRWWIEDKEAGNLIAPQTGDRPVLVWISAAVMAVSLVGLLILLFAKRKKEADSDETND